MVLKEYKAKRNFRRTSEPPESRSKETREKLVYVIQKHRASHLHYDLRLEEDGVLRSWAVPKEPVDRTGVKRLAVQTEDHPLGYEDFKGTIPEGEYGAGTVEIWDSGTYRPLEKAEGKLVVAISGRRLNGRFVLVRIKSREGGPRNWLFFKLADKPSLSVTGSGHDVGSQRRSRVSKPTPLHRLKLVRATTAFWQAFFVLAAFIAPTVCWAGDEHQAAHYRDITDGIRRAGLAEEGAFEFLRQITGVGPRLTGSPEAAAAVDLTRRMMQDLRLENIHLEPVTVSRWVRGNKEEAGIVDTMRGGIIPLSVCALGGSIGTPASGLTATVVEVRSFQDLARLGAAVKGKIVFFNRPMDRTLNDPFSAYGQAADQRVNGASEAARYGAVGVLVRSLTFRIDDHPHTGLIIYSPGIPRIPAAALATSSAESLSARLKKEPEVSVYLKMSSRDLGPVSSDNVVGEITGSEFPKEIILVGGHLDSWDLGTGAHDDGAGCAVSLEALKLIKSMGLRPKRTIRAVLFMDEEFGGTGGRFYVKDDRRQGERHLLAFESDRGGFLPLGMAAGGSRVEAFEKLKAWGDIFKPLGILSFTPGGGGVDIGPLIAQGTIAASVIPDSQVYFDIHHSALDVLGSVHPRELEWQAIILAAFAYILAQEGI